jgi:tetratricopeptide (TPR) repeat protein
LPLHHVSLRVKDSFKSNSEISEQSTLVANQSRANLEYQLAQDVRLASQLGDILDLLHEAVDSHRATLNLNPDNADILFNMGQVLTSLAEAILDSKADTDAEENKAVARSFLKEAIQRFSDCLQRQEQEFSEMQQQIEEAKAHEAEGGVHIDLYPSVTNPTSDAMETSSTSSEPPGDWATIIEPVTPSDLLETAVAQLNCLNTLVSISYPADASTLDRLSDIATPLITVKIPQYIALLPPPSTVAQDPTPPTGPSLSLSVTPAIPSDLQTPIQDDALLAAATFRAALLESTYRSDLLPFNEYSNHLSAAFIPLSPPSTDTLTPSSVNTLSAYADALVAFTSALADTPSTEADAGRDERIKAQYIALSRAQTLLSRLTAPASTGALQPTRTAEIFLARGDIELSRLRLANEAAVKVVLVKNAGVFYRGAKAWAGKAGGETGVAEVKAAVAEVLRWEVEGGGSGTVRLDGRKGEVDEVLRGMVEEALVDLAAAERARDILVG